MSEFNPNPSKVWLTDQNPGLQAMLSMQYEAQLRLAPEKGGGDPVELRSPDYIRLHLDALRAELQELQDETGWKPWSKDGDFVNLESARREWIDAWHFMMNLALTLGMNEAMIYGLYTEKLERNLRRWENDYDAREGKCAGCKRDFADLDSAGLAPAAQRYAATVGGIAMIFHNYECYQEHVQHG
jgi:hypothetical protein